MAKRLRWQKSYPNNWSSMYRINMKGMVSERCVRHLEKVLTKSDHKSKLEIQFENQCLLIETTLPLEKLKKIIMQEGYEVISTELRP
jgi:hypothetical protein